jgi:hypothetical protein
MNSSLTHKNQTVPENPVTRISFFGPVLGLIIAVVLFLSCEIQAQSSTENRKLPTKTNSLASTTVSKLTDPLSNRAETDPSQAPLIAEIDPKLRQPPLSISSDDQFLGNDGFLKKFFSLAKPHGSTEIEESVPIDLLFEFTRAPPAIDKH